MVTAWDLEDDDGAGQQKIRFTPSDLGWSMIPELVGEGGYALLIYHTNSYMAYLIYHINSYMAYLICQTIATHT